jgi:hypothetical protein
MQALGVVNTCPWGRAGLFYQARQALPSTIEGHGIDWEKVKEVLGDAGSI